MSFFNRGPRITVALVNAIFAPTIKYFFLFNITGVYFYQFNRFELFGNRRTFTFKMLFNSVFKTFSSAYVIYIIFTQ